VVEEQRRHIGQRKVSSEKMACGKEAKSVSSRSTIQPKHMMRTDPKLMADFTVSIYLISLTSVPIRDQEAYPVVEIGDIRNGLLLYNGLHRPFGDGEIAFLHVRNRS
jgi:hypothetical protein